MDSIQLIFDFTSNFKSLPSQNFITRKPNLSTHLHTKNILLPHQKSNSKMSFNQFKGELEKHFTFLNLSSQDYLLSEVNSNNQAHLSRKLKQLNQIPRFSKLDSLTVLNFKTFLGKQYIGPFMKFTSIVGSNGSGKSSIFDALMFCFCGQSSKGFLSDPRQYISRQKDQKPKQFLDSGREAYVEAKFFLKAKNRTSRQQTLTIKRCINTNANQKFFIDNQQVQPKLYQHFLFSRGIGIDAINYAVWQGDMDSILFKPPAKLAQYFQKLSGSIMLKKTYQEKQKAIQEKKEQMQFVERQIVNDKLSKKNLKMVKSDTTEAKKDEQLYETSMKKAKLANILMKDFQLNQLEKQYRKKKDSQQEKIKQIDQKKLQFQKRQKQKVQLQKKLAELQRLLSTNKKKYSFLKASSPLLIQQSLDDLQRQVRQANEFIINITARKEQLCKRIPQIQSSEVIEEYLKIYTHWQNQHLSLNNQLKKRKGELMHVQRLIQAKNSFLEDLQSKKKNSSFFESQNKINAEKMRKDISQLQNKFKNLEKQTSKIKQEYHKEQEKISKFKDKLLQIQHELYDLQAQALQGVENEKQKSMLQNLHRIQGFCGTLDSKIQPASRQHALCFAMLFQYSGKQLICQNQKTAAAVAQQLRDMRLMKSVVILENVRSKSDSQFRKNLGKMGIPAYDAVDANQQIKNLDSYIRNILFGKVVCQNLQTAYKIRDKRIPGVKQIYTIDGMIIQNDGMISAFGDVQKMRKDFKYATNTKALQKDIQEKLKQKAKIEDQIKVTQSGQTQLQLKRKQQQLIRIQSRINELKSTRQILLNSKPKQIQIPKQLPGQIKALESKRDKIIENISKTEDSMKKQDYFKQFMMNNKIKSLDQFRSLTHIGQVENRIKQKNKIIKELLEIDTEIQKNKKEISQKQQKIDSKVSELRSLQSHTQMKSLQNDIRNQSQELDVVKKQLQAIAQNRGLMGTANSLYFKSELPHLWSKIAANKQALQQQIKDQEELLQIVIGTYPSIDYSELFQQGTERSNRRKKQPKQIDQLGLNRKKIQDLLKKAQEQLQDAKQKLSKHSAHMFMPQNCQQKIKQLDQKIKANQQKYENLVQLRSNQKKELIDISKERKQRFMTFLNRVRTVLKYTYQILTLKKDRFGTADLFIEDSQLPFNSGLYYTPVPPGKKYVYDLSKLSGGEKTMAALALWYAIGFATGTPFIMFDQPDQFLDDQNSQNLSRLIKKSLQKNQMQFLVISHKEKIYEQSISLIGTMRKRQDLSSKAYSLLLRDPNIQAEKMQ